MKKKHGGLDLPSCWPHCKSEGTNGGSPAPNVCPACISPTCMLERWEHGESSATGRCGATWEMMVYCRQRERPPEFCLKSLEPYGCELVSCDVKAVNKCEGSKTLLFGRICIILHVSRCWSYYHKTYAQVFSFIFGLTHPSYCSTSFSISFLCRTRYGGHVFHVWFST